jgi:hypothetical protein
LTVSLPFIQRHCGETGFFPKSHNTTSRCLFLARRAEFPVGEGGVLLSEDYVFDNNEQSQGPML